MKNFILVSLVLFIVVPTAVLADNTIATSNGNNTTFYTNGVVVGQSTKSEGTTNYTFRNPTTGSYSHGSVVSNGNTSAYYNGNSVLVGTSTSNSTTTNYSNTDE
jgi:hypothetical protein